MEEEKTDVKKRIVWQYRLTNIKPLPANVEIMAVGSVYKKVCEEVSEHNNVYTKKELIGAFTTNWDGTDCLDIYLTEYLGDKIACEYIIKERKAVFYLDGYSNWDVIETIDVAPCDDDTKECNRIAYFIQETI